MCLIILQEKGDLPVSKGDILRAWAENSDGAGYMFVADGQLVIRKPFFKAKSFRKSYKRDFRRWGGDSPFVLHFRMATHGPKTGQNTHPHSLAGGDVGMVHNGILPWIPEDKSISDTVFFARMIDDSGEVLMDPMFHEYLGDEIRNNKLVFLDKHGQYAIVNETLGDRTETRWYSSQWFANSYYGYGFKFGKAYSAVEHKGWMEELQAEEDELTEAWDKYIKDPDDDDTAWERYMAEERRLLES